MKLNNPESLENPEYQVSLGLVRLGLVRLGQIWFD